MIASGTLITKENEAEWLAERSKSIGASEAAVALGISPYAAPIDLWLEKTTGRRQILETEAMEWGKILEPVIIRAYEGLRGVRVYNRQFFCRDMTRPWMTATLDGTTSYPEDDCIVEVKTASAYAEGWGPDGSDQIPDPYRIQVNHQMAVSGFSCADVVALIGGQELRIFHIKRDAALIQVIRDGEARFWQHVQDKTPPTYGTMDARILALLNPECHGDAELSLDQARLVDIYEELGQRIKRDESERDRIKNELLEAMGNAQHGLFAGKPRIKRYLGIVPEKTVTTKRHMRHYFLPVKEKTK